MNGARNGVKQYKITWLNQPESLDSWQLASDYDGGVCWDAYVELVEEWEEYKKTDPQYATQTTTRATTTTASAKAKTKAKATSSSRNKPTGKRKRSDSVDSTQY